jgi:polyhydroxyalkanoate synthesis regulator phasin
MNNNSDGRIFEITNDVSRDTVHSMHEFIHSLSLLLCKKSGNGNSTGIRPLLLDLQGFYRKDSLASSAAIYPIWKTNSSRSPTEQLVDLLDSLVERGKSQAFGRRKKDDDVIANLIDSCEDWDKKGFLIAMDAWAQSCYDQQELSCKMNEKNQVLEELIEELRLTEIHASIANSSQSALSLAQKKISQIEVDRMKRFDVLKDMVEECCIREMNLKIEIDAPKKDLILQLPRNDGSVIGLFDVALDSAGELVTSVHNF